MKSKFLNSIIILGSTVISVFSLAIGYKYVLAVPSSYQYSCPAELLQGTMLEANCLTTDGKSQPFTTLILKGIHVNSSGKLTQNALSGTSTFLNKCYTFSPYLYITKGIIKAKCHNSSPSPTYKNTSIRLEEITNHNGRLTYEWDRIIDQTAYKIMKHSFSKHIAEFSLPNTQKSKGTMSAIAKDIMAACVPGSSLYGHTSGILHSECKDLTNGRKIYWGEVDLSHYIWFSRSKKGTVVIVNGINDNNSTIFVPTRGKNYYDTEN
ncbi:hypothetical protein A6769_27555 [Nostoc punctiforme NIES-2108]|uniref:Cyanovirin-N domain-containing protein n=1 Tax=Nostoc punctiforme NIES-2108 TaxID=1356359 RepID=A0A367R810_NOSPU|nr:hypothetical protein A6769_27555 [Nostoc punctiforme NIES-2108]